MIRLKSIGSAENIAESRTLPEEEPIYKERCNAMWALSTLLVVSSARQNRNWNLSFSETGSSDNATTQRRCSILRWPWVCAPSIAAPQILASRMELVNMREPSVSFKLALFVGMQSADEN
jgi:hypothetical protein